MGFRNSGRSASLDFCPQVPFLVRFQGTGRGSFIGVRRGDGLVYFADHVRVQETYTNVENGKTLSQQLAVNSKDQTIVDNGDGTLTIIFKVTGRTFVYGPDGSRLFVDAGVFMGELLVDHGPGLLRRRAGVPELRVSSPCARSSSPAPSWPWPSS